ncbi:hypothetical protein QTO34_015464, partial [Cnephaeus nilssonii]
MTNTKGQRRATGCTFSRPFRKHGVVPLAAHMRTYKEGDIVGIKGMALFNKECPQVLPWATLDESTVSPSKLIWPLGKASNKTTGPRCVKYSKSQVSFLKRVKGNDQKKKEAKEKGTWVQLKQQPAPPGEAQFMRTNERSLSCRNPFHINSWHKSSKCFILGMRLPQRLRVIRNGYA